jgi:hypothetical protein
MQFRKSRVTMVIFRKNGALDHAYMKRPRHDAFELISDVYSFVRMRWRHADAATKKASRGCPGWLDAAYC